MPLGAKEIAALRNKIADIRKNESELAALKAIAKKSGDDSFPVIIKVLEEIYKRLSLLSSNDKEVEKTQAFLNFAIPLLIEADKKQNLTPLNIISIARMSSKQITDDLAILVDYAKSIKITPGELELWQEAALWMEGLYKRIYDKSRKEKDGKTILLDENGAPHRIDKLDKLFYTTFKLTKYEVSCYYRDAAFAIKQKISEYQNELLQSRAAFQPTIIIPSVEVTSKTSKENLQQRLPAQEIMNELSHEIENRAEKNSVAMQDESIPVLVENLRTHTHLRGLHLLQQFQYSRDEVRFHILMTILDELTQEEKSCLKNFKEIIHASLESYNARSFTTHWLPTFWFPRPHLDEVQEKMEQIDRTEDIGEYLKILYSLWIDMKAKNSKAMKYKTGCLLDNVITILLTSAMPEDDYAQTSSYKA